MPDLVSVSDSSDESEDGDWEPDHDNIYAQDFVFVPKEPTKLHPFDFGTTNLGPDSIPIRMEDPIVMTAMTGALFIPSSEPGESDGSSGTSGYLCIDPQLTQAQRVIPPPSQPISLNPSTCSESSYGHPQAPAPGLARLVYAGREVTMDEASDGGNSSDEESDESSGEECAGGRRTFSIKTPPGGKRYRLRINAEDAELDSYGRNLRGLFERWKSERAVMEITCPEDRVLMCAVVPGRLFLSLGINSIQSPTYFPPDESDIPPGPPPTTTKKPTFTPDRPASLETEYYTAGSTEESHTLTDITSCTQPLPPDQRIDLADLVQMTPATKKPFHGPSMEMFVNWRNDLIDLCNKIRRDEQYVWLRHQML
ncbi:hypothetical protein JAAARDRAFT_47390 [Jaapia argillacea MUCL 33604]|uniref:Uncharacterized protein n=1 Tax=Jaapia argillacea MUCL 33604 TaxID=933084 RepID=A0A067PRH7_9AGAM|nr:hypothetical protein JAAARDRAFT_47390 [Jaapia argillacea MUCL 33604]